MPINSNRALLGHEGEADASPGTTVADYQSRMEKIISRLRKDLNFSSPISWFIANATNNPVGRKLDQELY